MNQQTFFFMSASPDALLFFDAQSGCKSAMDKLLAKHQGLIYATLTRLHLPKDDDNIQAGLLGLWRAIRGYEPGRASFSTYAFNWIRQKVLRDIDEKNMVKRSQAKIKIKRAKMYSLDSIEDFAKMIPDKHTDTELEESDAHEELTRLYEHFNLSGDDREILQLRANGKTLDHISKRFGITREGARLRIARLIERLKAHPDRLRSIRA